MRDAPPTRTEALMEAIRARIASAALRPGERLPSVRRCAATAGVSPSTVVEAYARLEAAGVIRARRGSGFYVTGAAVPPLPAAPAPPRERDIDPFWVSRQALDADPAALTPGCGWLPPDWMPLAEIRKGLRAAARAGDALLADYPGTLGSPALRGQLLARFAAEGLRVDAGQVMLTGSGTAAIDLVCRLLLRPGDTVLVDDPCYFNFRALLRTHAVEVRGVPYTPAGPDVDAFEAALGAHRPRLYITNSALHNPTGATMSAPIAHRILRAAAAHGVTVVEDDIFADFEAMPSPRLALLDGLEHVIRIGSFSKTLSASLRCGYIAARPEWIEALVDLQVATSFSGPSPVIAELVAGILGSGSYRKHMEALRRRLARAQGRALAELAVLGIAPWTVPRGGFYLWCRLPDGVDAALLAQRCMREGVILAPGNVFSVSQGAGDFLRFNIAQMGEGRVCAAIARALGNGGA